MLVAFLDVAGTLAGVAAEVFALALTVDLATTGVAVLAGALVAAWVDAFALDLAAGFAVVLLALAFCFAGVVTETVFFVVLVLLEFLFELMG